MKQCTMCPLFHPVVEAHHVVPKAWWPGKPATPMRDLCPSCHYGTHAAMDAMIANRDLAGLASQYIELARQGLDLAKAAGLTPARTL